MVYQLWWSHMITISLSSFLIPDLFFLCHWLGVWLLDCWCFKSGLELLQSLCQREIRKTLLDGLWKPMGRSSKRTFQRRIGWKLLWKTLKNYMKIPKLFFSSSFLPLNLRDSSWVLSQPTEVQGWGRMMRHDCHVQNECGLCWCGNLVPKFRCKPEVLREFFLSLGTFGCPILRCFERTAPKKSITGEGKIVDIVTPKR